MKIAKLYAFACLLLLFAPSSIFAKSQASSSLDTSAKKTRANSDVQLADTADEMTKAHSDCEFTCLGAPPSRRHLKKLIAQDAGRMPALPGRLSAARVPTNSAAQKNTELAPLSAGIEPDELERKLKGEGLKCEIHAADPANRQFVATFRDPKDFFNNIQLVMVSHEKGVLDFFQHMQRHDRVLLKGEFFHQGEFAPESPQLHIEVSSIAMLKQHVPTVAAHEKFKKTTELPVDLKDKNEADFLVHAVPKNGGVLVLEYKDNFVFVVVPDKRFTENLFRNDRIHMRFRLQSFPSKPTHLELDTDTSSGKKPH